MATGWFQRATAAFSRSEPIPQRYEITCDCGARLHGIRIPVPQKPACPECSTILFVLPASVYPVPTSVQRRWLGTDQPETVGQLPKSKKFRSVSDQRREKELARKAKAERAITQRQAPVGPPLGERLRQQITPFRVIMVCVITGVALTAGVLIRNARWNQAQRELQGALDRGHAALDAGNITEAAHEFQSAVTALDILGRRDDVAEQIRRTAQEAGASASLSPRSMTESLEAWLMKSPNQSNSFPENADAWFLFDVALHPATAAEFAGQSKPLVVDLPLQIGKTPVLLLIEEPAWKPWLLEQSGSEPHRVLFAAQLRRGEVPSGEHAVARVWLNDATAILWSNTDTFPAAGSLVDEQDEATLKLIAAQREYLESRP